MINNNSFLKDINQFVQCFNCKKYFDKKDIVKVLAKPSIIQYFKGELNFNIICKGCINDK